MSVDALADPSAQAALRQAVEIAGRNPLPVMARSLTKPEHIRAERSAWSLLLGVPALLLFLFPFYALLDGDVGLALALWAAAWWLKWRAGRDYADPRIAVEATDEGLAFRAPGRFEQLAWADAAERITEVKRRGDYFDGLALDSPIGPLALDNAHFKKGRTTAAAVYGKCVAAGAGVS